VLSVQPEQAGDPAVSAIRELLGLPPGAEIPAGCLEELRLGTTVATNALLEQAGDGVLLITNQGLADVLRIGDQHRPELFALQIQRPASLERAVVEVEGRLDARGQEIAPLRLDGQLRRQLEHWRAEGLRSRGWCPVVRPPWWKRRWRVCCAPIWPRCVPI
jgi:5-oxoprolinase (ATP-hydrolysing)